MLNKRNIQSLNQIRDTHFIQNLTILFMILKEDFLIQDLLTQILQLLQILMSSTYNPNITQLQRIRSIHNIIQHITTIIHYIQLSNHTQCPLPWRIHFSSQLQSFTISQIIISFWYSQNKRIRVLNVRTY
jgi:hypothetical protein